jgi:hypothetical protein
MVNSQAFMKIKGGIFPEITDWKDSQNQWRNEKNVRKLTYKQWFWCHPSAFKVLYWGAFISSTIIFAGLSFYFIKHNLFFAIITGLIAIRLGYLSYQKIKEYGGGNFTFYDLYLKE